MKAADIPQNNTLINDLPMCETESERKIKDKNIEEVGRWVLR